MSAAEAEALTEQALEQLNCRLNTTEAEKDAVVHQFWRLLDALRGRHRRYPMATAEELEAAGKAIRTVLSQLSDHERTVLTLYVGLSDKVEDCSAPYGDRDRQARELLARIRMRYVKLVAELGSKDGDERAAC